MEPKQSSPNFAPRPEQMTPVINYEVAPGAGVERVGEQSYEQQRPAPIETAAVQPADPVLPTPIQPPAAHSATGVAGPVANAPLAANDDDLMEKEWVNQAKQVLEATKDDPYRRELEVGKLQRDYIYKRYGRKIGGTGE